MVSPLKVSSGQFPFHCSLGVSTRKARLAGVLHPVVDIVALKIKPENEISVKKFQLARWHNKESVESGALSGI